MAALSLSVDPEDPWGPPDAARLDSLSVGGWMRSVGARPGVIRLIETMTQSLSTDSIERTSLLAQLRKEAAAGGHGFYDETRWETLRVAEGSATVALRMAEELGERARLGCVVEAIDVAPGACMVGLRGGERIGAEAVVCARRWAACDVAVTGVSSERMSRCTPAQRARVQDVAAYPTSFWTSGAPPWRESDLVVIRATGSSRHSPPPARGPSWQRPRSPRSPATSISPRWPR